MNGYHFDSRYRRAEIRTEGLKAKSPNFLDNPSGVYFWAEDPRTSPSIKKIGNEYVESAGDLYLIEVTPDEILPDPLMPQAYYSPKDIPTCQFRLIEGVGVGERSLT